MFNVSIYNNYWEINRLTFMNEPSNLPIVMFSKLLYIHIFFMLTILCKMDIVIIYYLKGGVCLNVIL